MAKLTVTVIFGLIGFISFSQDLTSLRPVNTAEKSLQVMQDNEFDRNEIGQDENIHCNPLLINGQSLDYSTFTIRSKGTLTVIKGEPKSVESVRIPFKVHLRRDGQILNNPEMEFLGKELSEIDISKVLAYAQPGDQVIIDPLSPKDWKAKRILKLIL